MERTRIGVIGCGSISGAYLDAGRRFEVLEIVACADLDLERAKAKAAEFSIPRACSVAELLADPGIAIVVNLTPPGGHAPIALRTLKAGKAAYAEKPFATSRAEGRKVINLARRKGLLVGGAPDTFLGGGIQTCRKLIDDGWIGEPVAASAHMMCHGHESWHPAPEFYYQVGGGPLFDMGPYYLTALVNLLGPVRRVTGSATITFPERLITSQPKHGTRVRVECPTHVTGILEFASGAMGTITTSFDVWAAQVPGIEIYGSEGTLSVTDPNGFGGAPRLWHAGEWRDMPLSHGYTEQNRGLGVADMAYALRSGRPHRTSGDLAFHVLDIMESLYDASDQRKYVDLSTTCERPVPFPMGLRAGELDE